MRIDSIYLTIIIKNGIILNDNRFKDCHGGENSLFFFSGSSEISNKINIGVGEY